MLDLRSVHLPLLLLPGQVPHGVRASARRASAARRFGSRRAYEKQICCTKWVCEPRTKTCCYKVCQMVPEAADLLLQGLQDGARATDPHLLLQGLQDGAGSSGPAATRSATWCRSSGPAATRSATWCPSNGPAPCCYKVCKMVPEQRTCCYKVCHMVPEQRTRTVLLQGLPHGARAADLLLQGLPHGARATDPHGMLHGLQAGVLPEDHPGLEVRAAVRALHGDPLRAAVRLQAGSGHGLPCCCEELLRQWLRKRLRRW